MKKLLLSLLISFFSFQGIAQDPDPELFQTWYLYELFYQDPGEFWETYLIEPPISPYITISETLDFQGEGACNSFNGSYEWTSEFGMMATSFNATTDDCGFSIHNTFEDDYFGFMGEWWYYDISEDGDGLRLSIYQPLDPYAVFKNYPLSTSDFYLNKIKIYPNPVQDVLNISAEDLNIESIKIFSLQGTLIKEVSVQDSLYVGELSAGMYFLKITSEGKTTIKKFIKS